MRKTKLRSNSLKTPLEEQNIKLNNVKSTDINILLNKVRINQKKEFKKKINFFIFFITICQFFKYFFLFSVII